MGLFSSLFGCGSSAPAAVQYPEKIIYRFDAIKFGYTPLGEYKREAKMYIKQLSDGSFAAYEITIGPHSPYPIDKLRAEVEAVDDFLTKYQEERDGV